jgi:hypothetical protein
MNKEKRINPYIAGKNYLVFVQYRLPTRVNKKDIEEG